MYLLKRALGVHTRRKDPEQEAVERSPAARQVRPTAPPSLPPEPPAPRGHASQDR